MTRPTLFNVTVRNADGALIYWSGHRTPAAAARRLASLIRNPRQIESRSYPARFVVEDYHLHDSGAAFQERSLIDLRRCYGLTR